MALTHPSQDKLQMDTQFVPKTIPITSRWLFKLSTPKDQVMKLPPPQLESKSQSPFQVALTSPLTLERLNPRLHLRHLVVMDPLDSLSRP